MARPQPRRNQLRHTCLRAACCCCCGLAASLLGPARLQAWLQPQTLPSSSRPVSSERCLQVRQASHRSLDAQEHGEALVQASSQPLGRRGYMLAGPAALLTTWAQRAHAVQEVDLYFGTGNFFHLQHEMTMREALTLGRRGGDITAMTGYAGGKQVGDLDRVCWTGLGGWPDYRQLGHAQVVRVTLAAEDIPGFARLFFEEISKRKSFELGPEYRSTIGLRGGVKSKLFPLIQEANPGSFSLAAAQGDEPDTVGSDTVYVYDSKKFPFRPAEVINQFQNDPPDTYVSDYRALKDVLKGIGSIQSTGCPEIRV